MLITELTVLYLMLFSLFLVFNMAPIKKKKDKYESRKEQVKQNMKKMRERIRNDPVKYEEYKRKEKERYEKRRNEGKIKNISDLTNREKREKRKTWRHSSKKYRQRLRMIENIVDITPPASPQVNDLPEPPHETPSRQLLQGKRQSKKNRRKLHATIKKLEAKNATLKKKMGTYKRRCNRLLLERRGKKSALPDSPTDKVNELIENKENMIEEIRKKVLFGEVVKKQITENLRREKFLKGKRNIIKAVSGNVMKKYRFLNVLTTWSRKMCRPNRPLNNKNIKKGRLQKTIRDFLERDECSRMLPGKKDTITKNKAKRQKRFLSDSLKNLHIKFTQTYPQYRRISYAHFCKYRPFWILLPNVRSRETCACIHHENMALITRKLRVLNIIDSTFPNQLCKELCCEETNETCLSRTCDLCKGKTFFLNNYEPDEAVVCKLWINKKEKVVVKGTEKICQKTIKEPVTFSASELVTKLKNDLPKYMLHMRNIIHQYKVINDVKNNLADNEILIHMDFSENYNCKYGEEIQSAHFGGSKPQVSLHTVIVYHNKNKKTINTNYCTISESLRHDPPAICAHLEPVFTRTKTQIGKIKIAHFLSDGPTTQYKNKTMFYLIANQIAKTLEVEQIQWHYSESGHGKGAPDGIGGAVKRTADASVAHGKDVSSFNEFFSVLKNNCKKTNILSISEADICKFDRVVPVKLNAFKGTLKIRQIFWHNVKPNVLYFRYLSCLQCIGNCEHYHLGLKIFENHLNNDYEAGPSRSDRLSYSDVYSSSSDEGEVMDEVTGQKFNVADGSFVIVEFLGKKRKKYYIGKILSEAENDELLLISFLRRQNKSNKFVFPNESDIYPVPKKDIVLILKAPEERRNQYYFDETEIKNIENLE
ncbi:unnamed protein product [Psylliodes chrysocephalus]|uniref:Uncharacterized protein n=1 Tax=Psylliodes chrysocephalus TaxID=3402493 RepID=A0A9P0DDK7_9CUCU|nr:unnamed protein product [Psylliodes chrysocephala]